MACCAVSTVDPAGLATAVEQAADGVVITDALGNIQYVNPAFTATTGYSSEEVIGQNPRLLKSGKMPESFYKELWDTISTGNVWHGELINRRKNGTCYTEEMRITPVHDTGGKIVSFIAIKQDVTKRREAEDAKAFLAAVVEGSEDAILATTPDGVIVTWNHGAEMLLGYTAAEVIGKPLSMLVVPERLARVQDFTEQLSQGVTVSQRETLVVHKDGRRINGCVTGSPIRNSAGVVTAHSVILRDFSERKRSEQALRESEARLHEIFTHAPVGMYLAGPEERFLQVNAALCLMLGYSEEELLAKNWLEVFHPDDLLIAQQTKKQLWSGLVQNMDAERRYIHRDGHIVWCHVRVALLRADDGSPLYSVVHVTDIGERKRAEMALQEAAERLILATRAGGVGIWEFDVAKNELVWDEQMFHIYGIPRGPFVGAYETWYFGLHPEDRPGAQVREGGRGRLG